MAANIQKADKSYLIKWIVTLLVPLAIFLIPINAVYTGQVRLFFVITAFSLFVMAFEFFDVIVISVAMPVLWVLFGVSTLPIALSGWTTSTMYMCVGAFFLANALSESGLLQRIAVMTLVKTGGSWMGLLFGIYIVGVILSFLTFGMSYIILATFCLGICKALDLKLGKATGAIALACMLGCCSSRCYIYSPVSYAMIVEQAQKVDPAMSVNFFQAVGHNWPLAVASIVTLFLIGKFYKTGVELKGKSYFEEQLKDLGSMPLIEKKSAVLITGFFVLLLSAPFTGMDTNLLFAVYPWLYLMPGIRAATSEGSVKTINWQMVFFISSCMGIGTVASSLGLGKIIAEMVTPAMTGVGVVGFFSMIFGVVFVMNFLMTPLAIWSMMTEPLCQIGATLGIGVRPIAYALLHCSEAIILPYEYVPYLVVYSFGMISMGDFIKLNIVRSVLYFTFFLILLLPYWMLIGIL